MADQPSRSWNPALLISALASEVAVAASSSSQTSVSEAPSPTFPFQLPGGEPLTDGIAAARFIGVHLQFDRAAHGSMVDCVAASGARKHACVQHAAPMQQRNPVACAATAGNASLLPTDAAWEVESWLEWEERQLRSAVCTGEGPQLHAALRKLESAVRNQDYIVGGAVSLADLAVFTSLLPLLRSQQVQPCAAA